MGEIAYVTLHAPTFLICLLYVSTHILHSSQYQHISSLFFIFRYFLHYNEISNIYKEYLKQYPNLNVLHVTSFAVLIFTYYLLIMCMNQIGQCIYSLGIDDVLWRIFWRTSCWMQNYTLKVSFYESANFNTLNYFNSPTLQRVCELMNWHRDYFVMIVLSASCNLFQCGKCMSSFSR